MALLVLIIMYLISEIDSITEPEDNVELEGGRIDSIKLWTPGEPVQL